MTHLRTLLGAAALLLASSGTFAAEVWKYAIEEPPESLMDVYAKEFKSRIEQATQGDVEVKIYYLGQLGTSAEMVEQTADGAVNFVNVAVGALGTLVPESQVFLMNYVLPDNPAAVADLLSSEALLRGDLGAAFEDKGLRLQTLFSEGPQVWTTNRLVRSPADLKGFKMRVMVSPVLLDAYADLGASPTPMPFGEVYGGLQLKQIDGQTNPVPAIQEMKFYEVTDYMIWAGEQELVTAIMAGDDWYQSLPAQRQRLIDETIGSMNGYIAEAVQQYNAERLQAIKSAKPSMQMVQLSEAEREVFRQASQKTHEKVGEHIGARGKKLLATILQEVAKGERAN